MMLSIGRFRVKAKANTKTAGMCCNRVMMDSHVWTSQMLSVTTKSCCHRADMVCVHDVEDAHLENSPERAFNLQLAETGWHSAAVVDTGFQKHQASSMPDFRKLHDAAGVVAEPCGGSSVLIGGERIPGQEPSTSAVLHHASGRVQELQGLPTEAPILGHTLTALDSNFLLIVGGRSHANGVSLVDVEKRTAKALKPKAGRRPQQVQELPALCQHTAIRLPAMPANPKAEPLLIVGGCNPTTNAPNTQAFLLAVTSLGNNPTTSCTSLVQVSLLART